MSLRATAYEFHRRVVGPLAALLCGALAATAALAASALAAPPAVSVSFTWTPADPAVNQVVTFTSTSTASGKNNSIQRELWDLDGDGQFDDGVGRTVRTSFATLGDHTVRLRVIDTHQGKSHDHAETVTVSRLANRPPVASFAYYPATPVAGQPVSLYSTSTDPDSAIATQRWDLDGNGSYGDAFGPAVTRSFSAPGSYRVGLQVEDTAGAVSAAVSTLVVLDSSVAASLDALRPMFPFPVVRLSGTIMNRGIRVRRLTVDAPVGARTTVRCRGRGCPFRKRHYAHRSASAARVVRVRRLDGRFLRAGIKLQIFVTRRGAIGRYTSFRVRRHRPPARADRCLLSDSARPVRCSVS